MRGSGAISGSSEVCRSGSTRTKPTLAGRAGFVVVAGSGRGGQYSLVANAWTDRPAPTRNNALARSASGACCVSGKLMSHWMSSVGIGFRGMMSHSFRGYLGGVVGNDTSHRLVSWTVHIYAVSVLNPNEETRHIASCLGARLAAETLQASYTKLILWCAGESIPLSDRGRVRTVWLLLNRVSASAGTPDARVWFVTPQASLSGRSLSSVVRTLTNDNQRRALFAAAGMLEAAAA